MKLWRLIHQQIVLNQFFHFKILRHSDYLTVFIGLIICLWAIWHLFFEVKIIKEQEKAIAAIISSLGLVLAIFQIVFTQIRLKKQKFYDLRYAAYSQMAEKILQIMDAVNENINAKEYDAQALTNRIFTLTNSYSHLFKINESYLFPGLAKKESTIEIHKILSQIASLTITLRNRFLVLDEEEKKTNNNLDTAREKLWEEWKDETVERLKTLEIARYKHFKDIRKYF